MPIDSYTFGSMVVDGKTYAADLVLLPDGVRPDWWRKEGHALGIGDLQDVFDAKPDVLVIGAGAYGVMTVPEATRQALDEAGIEMVIARTGDAVEHYNALAAEGRRVAGAFHLTC